MRWTRIPKYEETTNGTTRPRIPKVASDKQKIAVSDNEKGDVIDNLKRGVIESTSEQSSLEN